MYNPISGRHLIASDNAGNKAFRDADGKVGVHNAKGQLVNAKDAERFLKDAGLKPFHKDGKLFV